MSEKLASIKKIGGGESSKTYVVNSQYQVSMGTYGVFANVFPLVSGEYKLHCAVVSYRTGTNYLSALGVCVVEEGEIVAQNSYASPSDPSFGFRVVGDYLQISQRRSNSAVNISVEAIYVK